MKKVLFPIIVLLILFRSGLAQSGPDGFDMTLDKKSKSVRCVSCGENGFCIVEEVKSRKTHHLNFVHVDTLMRQRWDTTLSLPQEWQLSDVLYEDGTLVTLCRWSHKSHLLDGMTILLYNTSARRLETREITGLPPTVILNDWHFYRGDMMFTTLSKSGDGVWFLPAGFSQPFPFTFTRENRGRVLTTAVDTAQGNAIICFSSGARTMYFETDFQGKSSFANIINEAATRAQWIPVGRDHSVLMLYYHDDEIFFMHPVNILNHKVMPADTILCADINAPKSLPQNVSGKRVIIVASHNYDLFYPTYATCENGKIACITELYYPEYSNYFNGRYVESRFDGYRYVRADVHFFDTNGVFLTNVIFPYDEVMSLHSSIYKILNISNLPNKDILLYHIGSRYLSTMLLDSECQLKSPVSTSEIPLSRVSSAGRYKTVPADMQLWYGNRYLFTAYRVAPGSQRKIGITANKLVYY